MRYDIHRVRSSLADAQELLAVEARTLADSGYTPQEVVGILASPMQRAYLALKMEEGEAGGGRAIGFCSCLVTAWRSGLQLEVDMLGVVPEYRGRGIARALVARALAEARADGLHQARAVAAEGNGASARVFRHLGFHAHPGLKDRACDLLRYEIRGASAVSGLPIGWRGEYLEEGEYPLPIGVLAACGRNHLLWLLWDERDTLQAAAETQEVQTLAYRGAWIEAFWAATPLALRALGRLLVERGKVKGWDEVGYLAPPLADEARLALVREGFGHVGRYRYWRRAL
ncbi:MAG: GNAT family N-acetyltransferase [Chloroflexi bacterium]|nr:GNAT family N-acetyltransferase [Chloroflexota bacterium]